MFTTIVAKGESPIFGAAVEELRIGITSMLGLEPQVVPEMKQTSFIWLGTLDDEELKQQSLDRERAALIHPEGYVIRSDVHDGQSRIYIAGKTDKGVLYACFISSVCCK
nr:alpha-glucuronidase family glycosyl hydrolase [Geobacillus thermodenitrificans]